MRVKICVCKKCKEKFCDYIIERLKRDIEKFNLEKLEIEEVDSWLWDCDKWPIIKIDKQVLEYANPIKASDWILKKLKWINNNKQKKEKDNSIDEDNVDYHQIIF